MKNWKMIIEGLCGLICLIMLMGLIVFVYAITPAHADNLNCSSYITKKVAIKNCIASGKDLAVCEQRYEDLFCNDFE